MKSGIALFDFDGTISNADTAKLFYKSLYIYRVTFLYRHILLCLPQFISCRFRFTSYLPLKRKRLQIHVGGLTDVKFRRYLSNFQDVILPSIIKESAMERINWHKNQGHDIWIVSASYDFLLTEWCEKLNIGLLVNKTTKHEGTCIFSDVDCNFSGKVNKIKKRLNLSEYKTIYAYGDSDGDHLMLSLAHEAHLNVFK
jgi:HAD superfamily hydrolase (TIGR01490 family)